jgi:hypothetical protein
MNTPSDLFPLFAYAFASAVIDFLATGEVQSVEFDEQGPGYAYGPVEPGTSPEDVGVWVGENWSNLTGPIATQDNPKAADYDPEKLRFELQVAAGDSPTLLKLALILAGEPEAAALVDQKAGSIKSH